MKNLKVFFCACCFVLMNLTLFAQVNAVKPGGADVAFNNREYKKAEQICLAELKIDPNNYNSWFYLCQSSLQISYTECIKYCNRALKRFPNSPSLREIYGAALYYSGQSEAAMKEYQFALKNAPDSTFRRSVTWYHVGLIYLNKEKYHKAVPALKRAITMNPWNIEWQVNYGLALEKASLKEEAIIFYRDYLNKKGLPEKIRVEVQKRLDQLAPQTVIEMKATKAQMGDVTT